MDEEVTEDEARHWTPTTRNQKTNTTITSDGGRRVLDVRRREGGRESEVVLHVWGE
jgi:hypothetical protein